MNNHPKYQAGFTLIEILVALTISLILMAGVSQIFLGNRESYRVQSGMATLQENGSAAMDVMRRELMTAGYVNPTGLGPFDLLQTADGVGSASDTVAVQYRPTIDCIGDPAVGPASNHLYAVDPITYQLTCTSPGAAPTILVDGIENMQVLYGMDSNGDGFPDLYAPAGPALGISTVVTARIAFLLNTVTPVARIDDPNTYALLDAPRITPPAANLRLGRRVFFGTVVLRNQFGRY